MQLELQHVPVADPPDQPVEPPSPASPGDHVPWPARLLTTVIVLGPLVALVFVVASAVGGATLAWRNIAIAAVLYVIVAHGVTIGFHRLFTHRSFEASRPLKIALAIAGSMSFQGSLIGWVAEHRRHHMFTDRAGDPHSPVRPESQRLRPCSAGCSRPMSAGSSSTRAQPVRSTRPTCSPTATSSSSTTSSSRAVSPTLLLPFALGYAIGGSWGAAFGALLWAGVFRVALAPSRHVVDELALPHCSAPVRSGRRTRARTWHPSRCCRWASRGTTRITPSRTWLATASTGTSSTARPLLIRVFERLGWAKHVRWPDAARLDARRTVSAPVKWNRRRSRERPRRPRPAGSASRTSPGVRVCYRACASELLEMDGAAIMLRRDGGPGSSFGRSGDAVDELEDLQFTLGEGPGIDAHASGRAGVRTPARRPRHHPLAEFAAAAESQLGCSPCFGFPLRVGAIRLGALDLYRQRPGSLTRRAGNRRRGSRRTSSPRRCSRSQAEAALGVIPHELELRREPAGPGPPGVGDDLRAARLGIADALVRLRAHAYAEGRPVQRRRCRRRRPRAEDRVASSDTA